MGSGRAGEYEKEGGGGGGGLGRSIGIPVLRGGEGLDGP